jgi:hypothetical protein
MVLPDIWQQLQRLPDLSALDLYNYWLTTAEVTPISNLQHLQRLTLRVKHNTIAAAVAAVVPAGLTALDVRPLVSCVDSVPLPLARLHDLQVLISRHCLIQPISLSSLTKLHTLYLSYPSYDGPSTDQGARELLSALQYLKQLQHLEMFDCKMDTDQLEPRPGSAAEAHAPSQQQGHGYECFSALTASSQLTALHITESGMPVPQAALEHMFTPGHVLPHLKVLFLSGSRPCVGAAQIVSIAASCPVLQQLTLLGVTHPRSFDNSCLMQLPPGMARVEGLGWTWPAV